MKKHFPIFKNNKKLVYLDNAATTQKPKEVIDSISNYYETMNANAHRGLYALSVTTTFNLGYARNVVAKYIKAEENEIIFTKSATEGFNMLAIALEREVGRWNNIIVSDHEHHSDYIPWQELARKTKAKFIVADPKEILDKVDSKTAIVAVTGMSNVTGEMFDISKLNYEIKQKNPKTIVINDVTQLIAHKRIDSRNLDADFLVFSAHKTYGPMGVGVVWGEYELLQKMRPFLYGGNMVQKVEEKENEWADIPDRFEAGTIDSAGIIAFGKAIQFLEKHDTKKLFEEEEKLKEYALEELRKIIEVKIIGHEHKNYGPVISMHIMDVHPHDLAEICAREGVCIRAGHHCAQPLMKKLDMAATARISLSFYNTKKDIDAFIDALKKARKIING